MMKRVFAAVLAAGMAAGCGGEKESSGTLAPVGNPASPAAQVSAADPSGIGTVSGRVSFEGAPPVPKKLPVQGNPECAVFHEGGSIPSEEIVVGEGGGLANAFVYVKEGLEGRKFEAPAESVRIGNTNCVYVPHVSGAMTGQPVDFVNDDPALHNVHSYSKANKSFNLGLPLKGMKQTRRFEAAEIMVQLKCDVHPWMLGYVGVVPHPFFAVTGKDGSFKLEGVPAGTYVIEAWHEKLGTKTASVTVSPEGSYTADFSFAAA